jgi:trehalose 6-phosphate synthase
MLAIIAAVFATLALTPVATSIIDDWSRRDVEMRSSLVFKSVGSALADMLANNQTEQISKLFEGVASDPRIIAAAYCENGGPPKFASKLMPSSLTCDNIARSEGETFSTLDANGRRMLVGAFPISTRESKGHLIIVHDLSFADERGAEARNYFSLALGGVILASGALALASALYLIRQWLKNFRRAVSNATISDLNAAKVASYTPLDKEVRQALRQLEMSRAATNGEHAHWSKEFLRDILKAELPDVEVMVVANREPYIHNHGPDGNIELQTPASGLVSALEPVMRACGGTWIAHGSGTADKETVDSHDHIPVPPADPEYTLRRIWITEDEQDGYYYGLANEGLWPLCHIAFTRPVFRESDWRAYQVINERFAEAVVAEARTKAPIVLVQDYHFGLLPRMVRERLPDATIITFWHIPWPNSETFGIFPWKEEIIHGLLGSSIIGFHTQFHCNNFLETVDRFVESRIDRERESIFLQGRETFVRPYPISIDWPPAVLKTQKSIAECRAIVREQLGVPPETKLAVGIERFDYTKGVLDRMRAVDAMLTAHPEFRGKFVLVQAAAPTRSKLPTYRDLQDEAVKLAEEINAKYSDFEIPPVRLIIRHHEPTEVFQLFRASDVCIISSLHDGMNLVAKEFIAARDDELGVLVLSSFAGASRELSEALIINPYDAYSMGESLFQALTMPEAEQHERMRLMRALVSSRNVYRWAGQMLLDASRLRKKQRILEIAATHSA